MRDFLHTDIDALRRFVRIYIHFQVLSPYSKIAFDLSIMNIYNTSAFMRDNSYQNLRINIFYSDP